MGNGGLISGAFSSASGKADTVMDTNGQILYYNNGRKALDKEDNDDVLQLKSGLPSWQPLSASGGAYTLIETKTLGEDATSMTITLSPVVAPPNAVYVTFSGEWDDDQDLGIQLNGLTSGYIQYGAIYKPSALSAIAQTGEDHAELVDNNISSNESGWASGLYRANPVSELIEGTSIGGGNTGWVSVASLFFGIALNVFVIFLINAGFDIFIYCFIVISFIFYASNLLQNLII